jgi:hypothetical protein
MVEISTSIYVIRCWESHLVVYWFPSLRECDTTRLQISWGKNVIGDWNNEVLGIIYDFDTHTHKWCSFSS